MLALIFVFVGAFAVLATGATFSPRLDEITRTITGTLAMVLWAYWSLNAFRVVRPVDGGAPIVESYQGLAAIAAGCAAIMLIFVVRMAWSTLQGESELGTTTTERYQ